MNEIFEEYGGLIISVVGGFIGIGLFVTAFINDTGLFNVPIGSFIGGLM